MEHFIIGVIGLGVVVGAVGIVLGDMVVTIYKHIKK
jgi:hypothetical protein